jgi:nitrate reductase NapE component
MRTLYSLASIFFAASVALLFAPPAVAFWGWLADIAATFGLFGFCLWMIQRRNRRLMKGWR